MKANTIIAAAIAVAMVGGTFPAMAREHRGSFIERSCERMRFESAGFKGPIKLTVRHPVWRDGAWQDQPESAVCPALPGGEGTPAREAEAIGRVINPFK